MKELNLQTIESYTILVNIFYKNVKSKSLSLSIVFVYKE